MTTNREINRVKLATKLAKIRSRPDLPKLVADGLDFWLKDGAKEIYARDNAELQKVIESLKPTLAHLNEVATEDASACHSAGPDSVIERTAQSRAPLCITNAEFMLAIFSQLPRENRVAVASFADVNHPNWTAHLGLPGAVPNRPDKNTYFCPSSMQPGSKRDLEHFAALYVVVLDDIKADDLEKLPPPTYALETSVGNYQIGYKLAAPLTDLKFARAIHQALQGAGYCDNNGNNPVRWVRLPVGINTKPGKMFPHRLQEWEPERRFEPMALAAMLGLTLEVEQPNTAPRPGNNQIADRFANMPDPKLQAPDALAGLLKKLDPDLGREEWRKVISCVFTHLGDDGFHIARNWSAEGKKYMLTPSHRKFTRSEDAEENFLNVWKEIAADTGFRMGSGALFDILKKQHIESNGKRGMSPADIAQWHKAKRAAEAKTPPPENFTLRSHFADHTLTDKDAEKMEHNRFIYPNLIPQGLITAYPSPPNGGKTAIFTHAACKLADDGYDVFYINADASPSQLKSQQAKATEHGFNILAPDAKDAGGVNGLMKKLTDLSQMDVSLSKFVLVVDTLKKFVDMLSKAELKNFINLLRKLVAKGGTVCLLVHTNKYLSSDGKLIYEGTADLRADIDNMIYLYSSLVEPGLREVTSEPDKTRTTFSPISFRIRFGEIGVAVEELNVVLPCFTDELRSVFNAAKQAIEGGIRSQEQLVQHVAEELMLGINKAREKIKEVADLKNSPLIRRRVQNGPGFTFEMRGEKPVAYGEF